MIFHFFQNPFELKRLGYAKYVVFAKKHLNYLIANNGDGSLTALINLLTPVIVALETWVTKQDAEGNVQKSKTESLDEIENNFEDFVDEVWDEATYKFAKKNPEIFAQCFPNGLSEYNNITRANAVKLITRVNNFCTQHKAELPAGMDVKATSFLVSYTEKLGEQQHEIGEVKDGSEEGKNLRGVVAKQMKKVFLNLLLKYEDNEEEVLKYYDMETVNYNVRRKVKEIQTPPIKA